MTTAWFVLTRTIHIGACLLFFGVFAFDRFVGVSIGPAGPVEAIAFWNRRLRRFGSILLPTILLSGIAWFLLVAIGMSGLPFEQALRFENLETVWNQTRFGTVWRWRLLFWVAAVLLHALTAVFKSEEPLRRVPVRTQLLGGGLLLGSLAWAGHGQEGHPAGGHLAADVVHLLAAGLWPTGLLPLLLLLRELSKSPDAFQTRAIARLVHRFSTVSLGAVLLVGLTGLVNSGFLVGSISALMQQPYGRWLTIKISLFVLTVLIGAVNLLRLKPRLPVKPDPAGNVAATVARLKLNIQLELVLGTAILVVVAILGILPPAVH